MQEMEGVRLHRLKHLTVCPAAPHALARDGAKGDASRDLQGHRTLVGEAVVVSKAATHAPAPRDTQDMEYLVSHSGRAAHEAWWWCAAADRRPGEAAGAALNRQQVQYRASWSDWRDKTWHDEAAKEATRCSCSPS